MGDWKETVKRVVLGSDWEMMKEGMGGSSSSLGTRTRDDGVRSSVRRMGASPLIVTTRAVFGELTVTFLFIFSVCATGANLSRLGISDPTAGALSTGFCAVALIYSFADVSGAHFNPAVTLGTIVRRKTSILKGVFYMIAQFAGATLAILLIHSKVFPSFKSENLLIQPADDVSNWSAFIVEFIMTFILVYVIFATAFESAGTDKPRVIDTGKRKMVAQNLTIYAVSANSKAGFAPLAIGFTLGFLCFVGSSVSGGAFNPARVFGANIVSMNFERSWVYYLGDFLGGAGGALLQMVFATSRVADKEEGDAEAPVPSSSTSHVQLEEDPEPDSITLKS
ncbi:MIP plasma membrane transporter [Pelomyxa schiedti]|nr:MIP plasma membrane transporter [Pelomyxa schiedti]